MNYNSYLNPYSVKDSCNIYITSLTEENQYYDELLDKIYDFLIDGNSRGLAITAMKEIMTYYYSAIMSLKRANELDIEDANKLLNRVGDEVIIGSEVISGKDNAAREENNNRNNASNKYKEAYYETDLVKAEILRKEGRYYDGLVASAMLRKRFFEGKEKRYDDICIDTIDLFTRASEIRVAAVGLLEELGSDNVDDNICIQYKNKLRKMFEENEPYENTEENDRENERIIWDYETDVKAIDESTEEGKEVKDLYEKKKEVEKYIQENPAVAGVYGGWLKEIDKEIKEVVDKAISNSKRKEEYAFAYAQLERSNYSDEEKLAIFSYWMSLEKENDVTGKEMPDWWKREYLQVPDELEVNEDNVVDTFYGRNEMTEELMDYYFSSYFIIDSMTSMGNQTYADNELDGEYVRYLYERDEGGKQALFYSWFDYVYGGMYDYVEGTGTNRAVKYGLEEKIGYADFKEEIGVYNVYTNTDDTYYEFAVESYISKYEHADHYYNKVFGKLGDSTDDVKANREKQITEYIKLDQETNVHYELTQREKEMLEYERTSDTFQKYGITDYVTADRLVYKLADQFYGIGERSVYLDGDKIVISFIGDEDLLTDKVYDDKSYELVLDKRMRFENTQYVSFEQLMNFTTEVTREQIETGYYTPQREEELNMMALDFLQDNYTEEYLFSLPPEELNQLIEDAKVSMAALTVAYNCCYKNEVRNVEIFNDAREAAITVLQISAFLASCSNPGTATAGILLLTAGVAGVADGVVWCAQDEVARGSQEILSSSVEIIQGANICYEVYSAKGLSDGVKIVSEKNNMDSYSGGYSSGTGSFKFAEMSEEQIVRVVEEYRTKSPVNIPHNANFKAKSMPDGYEQISYKWNDGTYKWEVRWHTRTSGAPESQGNTWVIQRTIPGNGGNKPSTQFMIGDNEWVEGWKWYDAIKARQAGNATEEQISILDRGHWKE